MREYKYMETDIRNLEAELEQLKDDLIPNMSADHVVAGNFPAKSPFDTSKTERVGIALCEDRGITGLEGLIKDRKRIYFSLRDARYCLEKDEMQFIWLRYDKEKSHTETWMALSEMGACMSESTYFRFRQKVINKIARYIGLHGY